MLLLDEPLASLDLPSRGRILRRLRAVHKETGIPMLYVSHALSEVVALAEQALVLDSGKQVALDAPRRVLHLGPVLPLLAPAQMETLLEGRVVGHHPDSGLTEAIFAGITLWLPAVDRQKGEEIAVAVPASDVLVAAEPPHGLSARNVLRATVSALDRVGDSVLVSADAGATMLAALSPEAAAGARAAARRRGESGAQVQQHHRVGLAATHLWRLPATPSVKKWMVSPKPSNSRPMPPMIKMMPGRPSATIAISTLSPMSAEPIHISARGTCLSFSISATRFPGGCRPTHRRCR